MGAFLASQASAVQAYLQLVPCNPDRIFYGPDCFHEVGYDRVFEEGPSAERSSKPAQKALDDAVFPERFGSLKDSLQLDRLDGVFYGESPLGFAPGRGIMSDLDLTQQLSHTIAHLVELKLRTDSRPGCLSHVLALLRRLDQ